MPDESTKDKSKAEVIAGTLNELNPEVKGGFHVPSCSISEFISNAVPGASTPQTSLTEYIKNQSNLTYPPSTVPTSSGATGTILLIGNDLPASDFLSLSKVSRVLGLPCILVRTYGMIGSMRIQSAKEQFTVLQPRPSTEKFDLRLNSTSLTPSSFPSLSEFVDRITARLKEMDVQQHSHVPYVALLCRAVKQWSEDKGSMPSTFDDKALFKETIKKESLNYNDELNYQEAVEKAYTAYAPDSGVPDEVKDLLESSNVNEISGESNVFDILLSSLKVYLEGNGGMPPLNGSIPDMTSDTDSYVELQKIYLERSAKDLKEFTEIVNSKVKEIGKEENHIPPATISTFVKNVPYLTVVPSKSYFDEMTNGPSDDDKEALMEQVWDPYEVFEHSPFLWWVGLKACEMHHIENNHWPGKDYEKDAESKKAEVDMLATTMLSIFEKYGVDVSDMEAEGEGVSKPVVAKIAEEMCRFNGAEMHNVGSVLGGVAGQEAVKIITGQYVPIKNTYLFNGIVGCAGVLMG
ncbi:hypothetical protein TrST_g11006 [Triparma strigata]|uniref:NEDD8-activating enzyme E1 regulatory subunit n=1 Tax=Triparma strigata TaxID=1606541 RepID=A0A9W6ZGC5_9STRA|nr:hypothetical protein TrST_g11006 [Triparma strigata]